VERRHFPSGVWGSAQSQRNFRTSFEAMDHNNFTRSEVNFESRQNSEMLKQLNEVACSDRNATHRL
jgi:hypothetical protein